MEMDRHSARGDLQQGEDEILTEEMKVWIKDVFQPWQERFLNGSWETQALFAGRADLDFGDLWNDEKYRSFRTVMCMGTSKSPEPTYEDHRWIRTCTARVLSRFH